MTRNEIEELNALDRLKIGIQKNGRLTEESLSILTECGLEIGMSSKKLVSPCQNAQVDLIYLRDDDIPKYLLMEKCDLGMVGKNILQEEFYQELNNGDLQIIDELPLGKCRMSLAFPKDKRPNKIEDISGMRIATTYPNILSQELGKLGIEVQSVKLTGGVEIAPILDICDGIFDIVSTGSTLKAHGLMEFETLYHSQMVLVERRNLSQNDQLAQKVQVLRVRIHSTLKARGSKYLMMNAPLHKVDDIVKILPGMESPSIIQLSSDSMKVAIHGVIEKKDLWNTIEKLKAIGASSILVMPIEKVLE